MTLAFANLLTMIATTLLMGVAMLLAWLHFGRQRFALLWAISALGAALQWTIALVGTLNWPGAMWPVAVCGVLIVVNASLIALGGRDLGGRGLHLRWHVAAAAMMLVILLVSLAIIGNRAAWAVAISLYVAVNMKIAAFGALPKHRVAKAPELAAFAVFSTFALFSAGMAVLALDFGADGNGPSGDTFRLLISAVLPGLYAAIGIASILLLAADLNSKLEALVTRDALTGTLNRRGIEQIATSAMASARRHGRSLSVAIADLDTLRTINERHGHAAGDLALIAFSDCMQATVREYDLFGRLGGDEFCLLLIDADLDEATMIVERSRREIEGLAVDGVNTSLTGSFGVARFEADDLSFGAVLHRADLALAAAKHAGGNRVEQCGPIAIAAE